jgi:hypothetical protein
MPDNLSKGFCPIITGSRAAFIAIGLSPLKWPGQDLIGTSEGLARVIRVISEGAPNRFGGPQYPVPRLV